MALQERILLFRLRLAFAPLASEHIVVGADQTFRLGHTGWVDFVFDGELLSECYPANQAPKPEAYPQESPGRRPNPASRAVTMA